MSAVYVALHNHSVYSLLDSACRVAGLAAAAAACGMPSLALTDHDTLAGAVEFERECLARGVRPILGCELTLHGGWHLTLLCRTRAGYSGLCRLLTRQTRERRPVPWDRLARHASGLLALSGCRRGEVAGRLRAGDRAGAERAAARGRELFGAHYYIEVFRNEPADTVWSRRLADLAKALGIGVVAAPNTHYLRPRDRRPYEVLSSIGTLTLLGAPHPEKKAIGEYHFRGPVEMARLYADMPEALEGTLAAAGSVEPFRLTA